MWTLPLLCGHVRSGMEKLQHRASEADVGPRSCPPMPMGLGSPQHGPLLASPLEPWHPLRADPRSLKSQRAGLVLRGRPSGTLPPTAACNHPVGSQLPLPRHPLCLPQPPRVSLPCAGAGSDLDNFTYHGRCLPFIPHCPHPAKGPLWSLGVTLTPGFGPGNEGP